MNDKEILEAGKEVLSIEINSIIQAKEKLSDEFILASKMIAKANKIIISGVGKSGLIARKIAATFSSIGISAIFLHPVEALHGDIGIVQKGDVSILLSKSGTTEELMKLIPYLKMRDSEIISILGKTKSAIARFSDIVLDGSVEKEACPFNLAPTSSSTLALAIGDALAIAVMKLKNVTINDFSRLHPLGQIGRSITVKVHDVMHIGESIPRVEYHSSFKDAIIEMTKKNLGCVCIVDNNDRLLGIITDGDIRRILQNNDEIHNLSVDNIMTKSPIAISEDAFLHEALALMENRTSKISVLPVTDDFQKIIGLIQIHDIVKSGS